MTEPIETTEPLLKIPEAAELLGLSASTLYRWSCTGRNRELFTRVGHNVRVRPAALRRFVHAGSRDDLADSA